MDFSTPIAQVMSRRFITVMPEDRVTTIKEIFDAQRIHRIPVVEDGALVGLITKTDILRFMDDHNEDRDAAVSEGTRYDYYMARDIMTSNVTTLNASDHLQAALQLFEEDQFHAIPVVEQGALVGMLTTFDIIKTLVEKNVSRHTS